MELTHRSFRIPTDMLDQLKRVAERRHLTHSEALSAAIALWLGNDGDVVLDVACPGCACEFKTTMSGNVVEVVKGTPGKTVQLDNQDLSIAVAWKNARRRVPKHTLDAVEGIIRGG